MFKGGSHEFVWTTHIALQHPVAHVDFGELLFDLLAVGAVSFAEYHHLVLADQLLD